MVKDGPIDFDGVGLDQAYAAYPTGVVAVAAQSPNGPVGFAAASFTSVSLEPPLVSITVPKSSRTWPLLRELPRIGLSVLSVHQVSLCHALSTTHPEAAFAETDVTVSPDGAVFFLESALWLDCDLHSQLDAGDHIMVLLRIGSLTRFPDFEPIVLHESRFRELIDDLNP